MRLGSEDICVWRLLYEEGSPRLRVACSRIFPTQSLSSLLLPSGNTVVAMARLGMCTSSFLPPLCTTTLSNTWFTLLLSRPWLTTVSTQVSTLSSLVLSIWNLLGEMLSLAHSSSSSVRFICGGLMVGVGSCLTSATPPPLSWLEEGWGWGDREDGMGLDVRWWLWRWL